MPWKECSVLDERLQFIARRLAGEQMADLLEGVWDSRKTGYKIFDRYKECGVQGLRARSGGGIKPGSPQRNGRHERTHLTSKK